MDPHAGQPTVQAGAALGKGRGVMIMVHGRNSGPRNILDLVATLDRPDWTYLAPAGANGTWYPFGFMADIAKNEPHLTSALSFLDRIVTDVIGHGIAKHRIVLLGFSQGACLSAEFAIRHSGRYGGIVVLSGGLIGPPGTTWHGDGSFDATPVFLGCSDIDAHIPKERVDESAAVFRRMGAEVTECIYPAMGHLINEDEIAFARAIVDRVDRRSEDRASPP